MQHLMCMTAESAPERLQGFLSEELRPYPGRLNLMLRSLISCALVIILSMTLQVPFLALSLITVFYVTQTNVVVTRLVGVLFVLGSTLAVAFSILLLKFTYDYPLLRILGASLLFLCSTFLMRTTKIGTVFFIVGIVVIYSQSFADLTDQGEVVLRSLLWVWVAVNYAIVVTLLINSLLLPAEPQKQLREHLISQLRTVATRLVPDAEAPPVPHAPSDIQHSILAAQQLLRFACMRSPDYRANQGACLARVNAISRLLLLAQQLPDIPPDSPAPSRLQQAILALQLALENDATTQLPADLARPDTYKLPAAYEEIRQILLSLTQPDRLAQDTTVNHGVTPLMAADAFSNPAYIQFSLKTLLAALICYVLYTACDWQGAHTIMLTCLIVAQPSLGATGLKSVLRIAGALIGSALALALMVLVMPQLDDIVGLLLIVLPVIALAAWISAGSERISYAGTQIMFTFALALLDSFSNSTDLTEIRDRLLGILLGIGISWAIHALLWPEAEGEALRQQLARLIRTTAASLPTDQTQGATLDPNLWSELKECQGMLGRVALEPGWQTGEGQQEILILRLQELLEAIRRIVLISDSLHTEIIHARTKPALQRTLMQLHGQATASLERYADWLSEHPATPSITLEALEDSWQSSRHELLSLGISPLPGLLNGLIEEIRHLCRLRLFDEPNRR